MIRNNLNKTMSYYFYAGVLGVQNLLLAAAACKVIAFL
jgi:hypothetical protein